MLFIFCYVYTCSNFLDHKVVGCPIHISLDYMARNVLVFNLCFVFDAVVKTARYELVLKKVANYLKALEVLLLCNFYRAMLCISAIYAGTRHIWHCAASQQ